VWPSSQRGGAKSVGETYVDEIVSGAGFDETFHFGRFIE
jgi:hypothetical protein